MTVFVYDVKRPELPPWEMPERFRHDVTYFMTPPGEHGVPELPHGQYWIRLQDARDYLDSGVIDVVSPLSSERATEVEISDELAEWLEWMVAQQVEHIRLK